MEELAGPNAGGGPWRIGDVESDDSIKVRLDAAVESQKRSRIVLLIIVVVSAMMIASAYNAYYSLQRSYTLQLLAGDAAADRVTDDTANVPAQPRPAIANAMQEVAIKRYIDDWVSSRNTSVSLLGIRISVDDAPAVGTIALLLIAFWFLLSVRRENNTISFLLRDTQSSAVATGASHKRCLQRQWRVFHGIVGSTLFTNFNQSLQPIDSLSGPNLTAHVSRWAAAIFGFVTKILLWLPPIASLLVFICDYRAANWRSPFREGLVSPNAANAVAITSLDWWMLAIWLPAFLLVFITSLFAHWYVRATESILIEYFNDITTQLATGPLGESTGGESQPPEG